MEIYGNAATFNLENVLKQNIAACDYYRNDCCQLGDWQSVIDEIYGAVEHVEPWLGGNARGPSTAFCLLHRLFTLKLSVDEIGATIAHKDSPFIRAIGFLYLRYVCDPRHLWGWCQPYAQDPEVFRPSQLEGPVTMGAFVRDLLLDQFYFETIFPRIPKKVQDEVAAALAARGLPTAPKGNGGAGGADRRGGDRGNQRPASVKAALAVAMGQKAPNRAGTRDYAVREAKWEEQLAGGGGGGRGGSGGGGGDRDRGERNGGDRRYDERRSYYDRRSRSRERHGGDRRYDERRRSSRSRSRERYRNGGGGGGERDRRHYDRRSRSRSRERHHRNGGGGGGGDRRYDERRSYYDRRSRSRSRERRRDGGGGGGGGNSGGGRAASDVFREAAVGGGADVRGTYGDASGTSLFDDKAGRYGGRTGEEVFRLGVKKKPPSYH